MKTGRELPVAVGVTDHEFSVLEYAAAEAERLGADLRLVHAYTVPPNALGSPYGYDIPAAFRLDGQDILRQAKSHVRTHGGPGHVKCVLSRGVPPNVLERESKTARLMVIGQDPIKPWYFRLYEGRSAHHLAEYSHCPVVIVPRDWHEVQGREQIVAFVDGPQSARAILTFAFDAAVTRDAPVKIVHVAAEDPYDYERWHSTKDVVEEWAETYRDVPVTMVVDHGSRQHVAMVAAQDAALLVLGQPHTVQPIRLASHSLARAVIARAACPVAVVPVQHRE
ncbi:nucleotide-binding universal stress UspA family protein [Aeromicrobium panaciterrae]|uniref:Nucleotide-binding universal stress UspA family protein n=1 Tax=Aeromicrobium panaciterrae TaxID=363861 RepID=A0ABU1UJ78_9ACTN|nr:universal stress protein [Aeromicrobium panaciterrae]MDR7085222.1 nucleotide-binding universal stress UspA family protein [Aeromicrobium panaciterrae]